LQIHPAAAAAMNSIRFFSERRKAETEAIFGLCEIHFHGSAASELFSAAVMSAELYKTTQSGSMEIKIALRKSNSIKYSSWEIKFAAAEDCWSK